MHHLDALSKFLDLYSSKYEKVLILGDFNVGIEEKHIKCFCDNYNFKSLIKQPTCYKNPDNPTFIDLMLTNAVRNFQSTCALETGLSDFHLMTVAVMRKSFKKLQPRIKTYTSYKNLSNEKFKSCLLNDLRKEDFVNSDKGFEKFCNISVKVLNKHAPRKKKIVRGNRMPFYDERSFRRNNEKVKTA